MERKSLALGDPFGELALSYLDWGDPGAARTVVCVHGLTRNARDFDVLAKALAAGGRRVLAVDVAGRGGSGWLADPAQYAVPVYAAQLARFLHLLGLSGVDWIGTSMGGLIGITLAAGERPPMARLVLNDIGPFVSRDAMDQIRGYLGLDLRFKDLAELEAHLRLIHAGFGRLTDAQWRTLALHSSRETPEGLRLHYDPAIHEPFLAAAAEDIDLWELWDRIRCPTFVLRGAECGLLTAATLEEMRRRGPPVEAVTLAGVGHAPALMSSEQIAIIERWLGL
jgi:pimeloyl-ACP methyl ester carboxylesterase